MSRKYRSILDELDDIVPKKDRSSLIEARASHIITSAHFLMEMISKNYEPELADQIQKRLVSAIRTGNVGKFSRYLSKLQKDNDL